jgi:hypothetical protein
MTHEEMLAVYQHAPVLCKDGQIGLLIGYPIRDGDEARIQVPGEEEARRILPARLHDAGGDALFEDDAPPFVFASPGAAGAQVVCRRRAPAVGDRLRQFACCLS